MVNTKLLLSGMLFWGLLASAPVKAFSFKYDSELQERLGEFEIACQMMDEQIENKGIVCERRIFRKPKLIFADQYNKQVFECYTARLDRLWSKLMYNALGDGFLLGLLAGAVQPIHGMKASGPEVQMSLMAGTWLMTALQDHQIKNLPYYDRYTLKSKSGLFKWWRMWLSSLAASATLAGIDAIIRKRCF